jgi:hypothetical protein
MKRFSPPSRTPAKLSDSINRHLNMYTLTATAAGVGLMALAQPVQAKIVYMPAHRTLGSLKIFLDLNHDGKNDLRFDEGLNAKGSQTFTQYLWVEGYDLGNGIVGTTGQRPNQASALRAGARIGSGQVFNSVGLMALHFDFVGKHSSSTYWKGQWVNGGKGVKNRYLGLKFNINGKVHFGWARITVTTSGKSFTATLTGYAYETIPNKSIIAGKTKGPDEAGAEQTSRTSTPTLQAPSLGLLAMGSHGLSIWRRKESAEPTQW